MSDKLQTLLSAVAAALLLAGCQSNSPERGTDASPAGAPSHQSDSIERSSADLVFENCSVVTMTNGSVLSQHSVVIAEGKIVTIAPTSVVTLPADTPRYDCQEQFLLPGLTDAHVHIGDPSELISYLRYGVTTVFNLGGDHLDLFTGERIDILALRDAVNDGTSVGARILTSGQALDGNPPTGPFQLSVATEDAAAEAVARQAKAGFDLIKVYDSLTPQLHAAIIAAAAQHDLPVVGHVPEAVGVADTLASGQRLIAHAEEFYPAFANAPSTQEAIETVVAQTAASGAFVTPNSAFVRGLISQVQNLQQHLDKPDYQFLAPRVRVWWEPRYNYYVNRDNADEFLQQSKAKYDWLLPLIKALHDAGVPLLSGSDASIPVALPGRALHEELADLVSAGLSPFQALQTSTTNVAAFTARFLPDKSPFGQLRVGHRADLIVVADNPLENIRNLLGVEGVMAAGRWYTAAELDSMLKTQTADWRF